MLPAGRLAVLCLRYLSDVYNALPEQQMSIHLEAFDRILISCGPTALEFANAASMPLYEHHSQQASADVAQWTGDLDSSTAQQLLKDPCYLQCSSLSLALVSYHLTVVRHSSSCNFSEVAAHCGAAVTVLIRMTTQAPCVPCGSCFTTCSSSLGLTARLLRWLQQ